MAREAGGPTDPTRERLIDATIGLLARSGPSELKVRRIAEAAGASTIAVYHHFGGLPELLHSVLDHAFGELRVAFDRAAGADPDPAAQLFAMALQTRETARRNPHLYDMMFGLSTRGTYRHLAAAPETTTPFRDAYAVFAGACERLVASGRIDIGDADQVAAELWSMVHGFVTLESASHFRHREDPVHTVLAPMAVHHLVGMGDTRSLAEESAAVALGWWQS